MGRKVHIDRENGTIEGTRKLHSSGSSTVLTIPQGVLDAVGMEQGDDIHIQADLLEGDSIVLRKVESGEQLDD